MTFYNKIFFISILFLFVKNSSPQSDLSVVETQNNYSVENITVSNGLYNNYIYDVLQDHLGFLWLASDIGLQKYDGYTFTLYTPDSSDITTQKARRLYEDKDNNLWIQMEEGLLRYRRGLDDFVEYYFVNSDNDSVPYEVTAMAEDLDGTIWVWVQDKGLYKVDPDKHTFVPHSEVNNWFRTIKNPIALTEGNQKGIYETWVNFSAGQYGLELQYKFAIKRKDGTVEWEPFPNPDSPGGHGNRHIILSGDTLNLPLVYFNARMKTKQKKIESINISNKKTTKAKFSINLNKLDNALLGSEEIQIRGNRFPLMWGEYLVINSLIFDRENKLWIGLGSSGLVQFNLATGEFKNFVANPKNSGSISSDVVNDAICDQEGSLWFGGNIGINRYNPNKDSFENYLIDPSSKLSNLNHIFRMTDDGRGNIWTISKDIKGIGCFKKLKKEFIHNSEGMYAWISSVTTDRSGIVWLSNWYQGIYKIDPNPKKFSAFSVMKNGVDILDGKLILALYEDQVGNIWFGGDLDGLYCYNRETGKTSVYKIEGGNFDSNIENYIMTIFQDSKGNFWIGTKGGLCLFNSETGSFKHILQHTSIYQGLRRIGKILEDKNGRLWLITLYGFLVQFDPSTYNTDYYTLSERELSFREFVVDPQGFLWIGSTLEGGEGGVLKFDLSQKKLSFVKKLEKLRITSLCLDDGILWCATNETGLIRYDIQSDTKTSISTNNGLISNSIMGLEKDDAGNLWISSPRGLTKYNPQKEIFNHYFKEDGFFTNEFTYTAHSKANEGEMIFGSLHGVVTFYPDSIKNSEYVPHIVLTDLKIQNEPVGVGKNSLLKKNISVSDEIELSHDQNDLTITFAALDFNHPERIKYSFYLKNFEEDWRSPGLERTAYYTNLDPGEYVFKVKGTNSDGVWNEAGTSVKIIILPPWWATWWAYTLYILFGIGLLYSFRRYELNRTKYKNQVELDKIKLQEREETDRLKSRFFANISHEFRTPLTLILGPAEKIISNSSNDIIKDTGIIKRNASRLLKLVNQLLDLSRLESGKLNLRTSKGNIVSFIKGTALSFESLSEVKDIMIKFKSDKDFVEIYFDREMMVNILSNLLSNAFKFTPEGEEVIITVSETLNGTVEIAVKNTGIGISPNEAPKLFDRFYQVDSSQTKEYEGTGIGLALVKELVELHHGTITVDSEIGKWTEFRVVLPVGRAHLKDEEILTKEETPDQKEILVEEEEYFNLNSSINSDLVPDDSKTLILVVEDNYDMREYIRESLSDGYNVEEAINGEQGVRIAEKIIPDLIISDLMMPKMDGNELTRILKNDERTSHIPIILLTAKSGQENKLEGLQTGADAYLTKPFDLQELRVRVENLISIRKKLQEKFSKGDFLYKPSGEKIKSIDEKFLAKVIKVIQNHLSEEDFSIEECGSEVGMSRTHLYKKIKALVGKSPSQYVRSVRLNYAKKMVEEGKGNISEIAYSVGFSSPAYFSRCFKEEFGLSPKEHSQWKKY